MATTGKTAREAYYEQVAEAAKAEAEKAKAKAKADTEKTKK